METGNLEEDVCSVVAQESQALVEVLCSQRHDILRNLCSLVTDQPALEDLRQLTNLRECATRLVGHFKTAEPVKCAEFLQALCMSCENMPMLLESQLMCAAGCVTGAVESNRKRQRLDHVQNYVDAVKTLLLQKYKRVTQDVVREVHLHETWVSLQKRTSSRNRVDRIHGQDGEDSSVECRVTVESLLGNSGQVIVLLGQAGSGKTLLMHCLGHRWAQGAFPSFHLLFLLEFRQLNLVGQPLSLKELLFRFVLPPSSEDQGEEVLDFISSNPEKVCLIFDGYDEFRTKFANPDKLSSALDSSTQLPIAELLSGLCSQKILSKCTLLVTCRPRDVTYMFHNSGYIGELLGFDQKSIQEYTEQFFQGKDRSICERAITHLMTSRHLLTMCHVPALCHICCVCLDHLFSTNGWQNSLQLPRTLTQIYLQILSAFLHRNSDKSSSETVGSVLQRFRSEIRWLGSLAMEGLEDRRIVFEIEESPLCFTDFATRVGILCQVDLNFEGRYRSLVYSFMHLTMQEFLGAVHLMTSESVTDAAFKKKLALKTRWAAKNEPKMVFTDSIQLFLCGLASSDCMPYLILLAGDNAEARLRKRQSTVLKVLESFAGNANLTGPKIVELCRCTHETQDVALAMKVGSRQRFELRNIRVNPVDLDALAFVISAAEGNAILDFGGCSLEPECLDVLPNCKKVESLIFHSRKYDDKFAQSLSGIIPKLQTLKQLEFTNCSLTDDGATKLIHALKECPMIEKINLSGNILTNKSLKLIVDTLPRLLNVTSVLLERNSFHLPELITHIEQMMTYRMASTVYVTNGMKDISLNFSSSFKKCNTGHQGSEAPETLVFTDCKLLNSNMDDLCSFLGRSPFLVCLDISRNLLHNKGLQKLLDLLPQLKAIQEINVSENDVNMDGIVSLAGSLCTCTNLSEVDVSCGGEKKVMLKFRPRKSHFTTFIKRFCLTHSDVSPSYMNLLCKKLVDCPNLLDLDFSFGSLKDDTIEKLLNNLPKMTSLQLLIINHVQMSTNGALILVKSLIDCKRVEAVELRPKGDAFIKFVQMKAEKATCRLTQYVMNCINVEKLSGILEQCANLSVLDLSSNLLRDEGVEILVRHLSKFRINSLMNLNDNSLTQLGALHLVNSMSTCEKVVAVEVSLGTEEKSLIHFVQDTVREKTLSLRECKFGADHLQQLMEILNRCPKLVKLELSCNTFDKERLHILYSLAKMTSLYSLEIKNNDLDVQVFKELFLHMNKYGAGWSVRVQEKWIKAEAAVTLTASCLSVNPNILDINITDGTMTACLKENSGLTEPSVNTGPSVRSISITDCDVEGRHLTCLEPVAQKCYLLQEFELSLTRISREGAAHLYSILQSLVNLKKFSLHTAESASDEVVLITEALCQHQHFESLALCHHVISDDGAARLGRILQNLPHLKSIDLAQCSGWTPSGSCELMNGFGQCFSLESVRLEYLQLEREGMACLAQSLQRLTAVRWLRLNKINAELTTTEESTTVIRSLMFSLKGFREIEELELEDMRMGESGVEELIKLIPTWKKLRRISLSGNCVSDRDGEWLVEALTHCRALEELNLSKNKLSSTCAVKLGQTLPSLTQLRVLDLSENLIDAEGSLRLSEGLHSLKSLIKLHLTSVGTPDLAGLAEGLKHCTNIEDVSLAWNSCGDDVAEKLSEVLPLCLKLKRLDLECNKISTKGAKLLAESLRSCSSLEVVRLWKNPINNSDSHTLRQTDQRLSFSSIQT